MTDEAQTIPAPVAERLQTLKPVYDKIKELQVERDRLTEARAAGNELNRVLGELQNAMVQAQNRRDRLQHEIKQLDKPVAVAPVAVGPRTRLGSGPTGPRQLPPWIDTPAAQAAAGEDRTELTRFVGRHLGYALSVAHPEMLAQFNQIMNSPDRPVGEGLALLDWDIAYCRAANKAERDDPQNWVARLDRFAVDLEKYRDALAGDVGRLRSSAESMLPQLDAWRGRVTNPAPWAEYVAGETASLAAKRAAIEKQCADLEQELARKKSGGGQP